MRVFHKEFGYRYDSYEFGYSAYAEVDSDDVLVNVYDSGFLPYSADPQVHNVFYMARSVRVPLSGFSMTSENRRIQKKFADTFTVTVLSHGEILNDTAFLPCFLTYFKTRHGERVMNEERAHGILSTVLPLRAVRYERDGIVAGYVLEVAAEGFSHYWYSCYTESYTGSSFGMWLMLDAIERAKDEGRAHIYLGTAYGYKGKYKTNFHPLEFWDGDIWSDDTQELKRRIGGSPE